MLRPDDRPGGWFGTRRGGGSRLAHGHGEHALPGAVFQRKERPALRASHFGVHVKGALLQATLKAAPAPEGFAPVGRKVRPEIDVRTGKTECGAHGWLKFSAAKTQAQIPPQARPEVAVTQKFLKVVKAGPVLALGAEPVTQGRALREAELRRGKTDEKPAHPGRAFLSGIVMQHVVQLFPVAGAKAPLTGGLHVHIGKVGGNGGRLHRPFRPLHRGEGLARVCRCGQPAAHGPQPVPIPGQSAQGRGRGIVQTPQKGRWRLQRRGHALLKGKRPAGRPAHVGQNLAQGIIPAAEVQGRNALLIHKAFKGAQLVHGVQARRHLGMALIQQRAPPHGQCVPGPQPVLRLLALHCQPPQVIGPGRMLRADGFKLGAQQGRQRDVPPGRLPALPLHDGLPGLFAAGVLAGPWIRLAGADDEDEFLHASSSCRMRGHSPRIPVLPPRCPRCGRCSGH